MTTPNTGPLATIATEIPYEVWLNWRESFAAAARAKQIATQLPGLDQEIAKAQAHLDWLKSQHKQAGRDMTEQHRRSEVHRELVELWCTKHGRELPPDPDLAAAAGAAEESVQQALPVQAGERKTPCMENPPRCADCGDLFCPCVHHKAERDAITEEEARRADILGTGVAGETTTQTRTDSPDGGGGAGNGSFPRDPEHGDGRGDGRA